MRKYHHLGIPTGQRWSGVLEKRAGRWLIAQMHFSFASDMVAAAVKAKMAAAAQKQ